MSTTNMSRCACGVPWEYPCRCPERVLSRFSETLEGHSQCFYFDTFRGWMREEFGAYDPTLGDSVLNLDGVIELGADGYQTPYERG